MLLVCNQIHLETALMQCHAEVHSQFHGMQAVSRALLTIWNKCSLPCAVRYFLLIFLPGFMLLVLVLVGSLHEVEGCICLGVCLVSCLNRGDEIFLKPSVSTASYHCSRQWQGLFYYSPTLAFCMWPSVLQLRPQHKCSVMSSILTSVSEAVDCLFT